MCIAYIICVTTKEAYMRIKLLIDGVLTEETEERAPTLPLLQRLDRELVRRGEVFRELGVSDSAGYRNSGHTATMPVLLLSVEGLRDFYSTDDRISLEASLLLDRIIRQGAAFDLRVKVN
jgi:S-DNA-T family DNA segregation ATPase FtsK/SpoIIIE